MNGLLGVHNPSEKQIEYIENYNNTSPHVYYRTKNSVVKLFYPHGRENKIRIFSCLNNSIDLIVFGDIFLGDVNVSSEHEILLNHEEWNNLNGEYIVLIFDNKKNSVEIFTDKNYATPLFYACMGNCLIMSSFLSEVHRLIGNPKVMYQKAVHDFLAYGNTLGDDTFFKDVKRLCAGYRITYADNIVKKYQYKTEKEEYFGDVRQAKNEVMQTLISAVRKRLTSKKIAISMSGGMDSRFMLGILKKYFSNIDLCGYMWSQPHSRELEIARQCCEELGVEFKPIILSHEDFIADYDRCCDFHGGNDYVFQSFAIKTGETLEKEADLVFTGFCLDLSLGCTFSDSELMQAEVIDNSLLQRKRKALKADVFLTEDFKKAVNRGFNTSDYSLDLYDEFSKHQAKEKFRNIQDFVFSNRVQNLVINRDFVPRQYVEYAYPSVDSEFIRTVNRIPYDIKGGHAFYRELFIEEFPELAQIEYFNTGLPIAAPVEYWNKGKEIAAQREKLFNQIFYNTGRTLEFRHYYSNYDHWISGNGFWRAYYESIIYSEDAAIYKTVFIKEYVRKIYEDHIAGIANNRKKLVSIITLQRIMQYYNIESVE